MPAKVTLRAVKGPLSGKVFEFDEHDTFLFGRAEDCHCRLSTDDKKISRHHFILEVNPPVVRLRDLGSLNGTYVNDVPHGGRAKGVAGRRPPETNVRSGDRIRVGETAFEVEIEGAVELAPTEKAPAPAGREGGKEDPAEVLERMIAEAARARGGKVPTDIAGYTVEKKLGAGGMGAVYLVRRGKDGARFALKVMLAQAAVDEDARMGFLREALITRAMKHPNIVTFFEQGAEGHAFYFVMEYCPGGSVDRLMARRGGRLPLPEASTVIKQALQGLEEFHKKGNVHRDLKPQNILLTAPEGGVAKVSDFGLAKDFDKAGLSGLTMTNTTAGTPWFMPREQVTNYKYVKPVTDVWSMGATLYNMLTGAVPRDFPEGADPLEVILNNPVVPIRKREPSVPAKAAVVIERALAEDVKHRYPTAAEFRKVLERVL